MAARKKVGEALESVSRIPKGDKGKASTVITNNFPLKFEHDRSVYQYDVAIEPNLYHRDRPAIVRATLRQAGVTGSVVVRGAIAYASQQLHPKGVDKLDMAYVPTPNSRGVASKERKVTLAFTKLISPPTPAKSELSSEWYTFVMCLLTEALEEGGLTKIGGAFYDLENGDLYALETPSGDGINLLTGLKVSLHPTERCGLMLVVDLATRVTRKGTVWDVIKEARAAGGATASGQQACVRDHVEGATCVVTGYKTEHRRQAIRADKIRFDLTPRTLMSLPPGAPPNTKRQTYAEYLNSVYGIPLKDIDMTQPLIEHESKRQLDESGKPRIFHFVPQMMRLASQSKAVREDHELQKRLKAVALMAPETRFNLIFKWVRQLTTGGAFHRLQQEWRLGVTPRLVEAPSRDLPSPSIVDGSGKPVTVTNSRQWLVKRGMALAKNGFVPKNWTVVTPLIIERQTRDFVDVLMSATINGMGARWPQPSFHTYRSGRDDRQNLRTLKESVLPEVDADAEFVLFVLPSDSDEFYNEVKSMTLQEWKVPSQCVLFKNVQNERNHLNVASRVGGQMLVKAGGELWGQVGKDVPNSLICGVATAPVGADVVAAVCVMRGDDLMFVYEGSRRVHARGVGKAVCEMVGEAAAASEAQCRERKTPPPTSLVVFRSGMDEGSVPDIAEHEVVPLRELCGERKWKLCVVASLKRCLTRFYSPAAGCIVDSAVLPNTGHTFLMVPHNANVGTPTPMKLSVLCNDIPSLQRSGNTIQEMSFKLCHMFFGWWGATREPAPVMYAERHAELVARLKDPKAGIAIPKASYVAM